MLVGINVASQVKRPKEGIQKLDCSDLSVGGNFVVSGNPLESLRGSPRKVGGYFASNCRLKELRCQGITVEFTFNVSDNRELTTLANGPAKVGSLDASSCWLEKLECADLEVQQGITVGNNPPLKSLAGRPNSLGYLYAYSCGLERLECRELTVFGTLDIRGNHKLESMLDGSRCAMVQCEDVPALGLVGRCGTIDIDYSETLADTVFRTKLRLIAAGFKNAAKIAI